MFSVPNSDDILQSLQLQSQLPMSKFEGTFEYDIFSSNAIEFMKTYVELGELYKVAFADTSYGDFLTARAKEAGIIRKEATRAHGTIIVTGNGVLHKGSQFATEDGIIFETTKDVTIKGATPVTIQAINPGVTGNVSAGAITVIPMSIPGVQSVTNTSSTLDGFEQESDDALRERYLVHVRTPGTSGNKFHYYEWAMSVPGVGGAKIVPTWAGPGTVKIIIVNSEFKEATDKLVKAVFDYIESVRPMGAMVTVKSAIVKPINISVRIEDGSLDMNMFTALMHSYLISLEKQVISSDSIIKASLAKVGSLVLDAGATDYSDLTINGTSTSITLLADDLPTLGKVTKL